MLLGRFFCSKQRFKGYLLLLLLLSSSRDQVGRQTRSGPPRPSLTGSCRFEEQACHVMEGCQDNVSSSCRLRP